MTYVLPQDRKWDTGDRIAVFFLILFPCTLRLWLQVPLDNDTFFLLSHGRYVWQHGWPTIEPFTFHEGLRFVMQQWLCASIFYYIYSLYDFTGLYILTYLVYLLYGYVSYKLSMLLSNDNLPISATTALAVCVGMGFFIVLRPWIFSTLFILVEIYWLELYIYHRKYIYLLFLPIISLLMINLHAAVWPLFFIFFIPYVIDGFRLRFGLLTFHGYGIRLFLIIIIIAFLISFINPYTIDAITYLYDSYGNEYVNLFVGEMQTPSFKNVIGILIFIIYVCVALAYSVYKNGTTRVRYVIITLLTAYMGLSSARSLQYFFICFPFLAYYYRDMDILEATKSKKSQCNIYTYIKIFIFIAILIFIITNVPRNTENKFFDRLIPVRAVEYILKNLDIGEIRIFNDYDTGDYLAFMGIKPFIDTRAEVFLKSNNKKEDILHDYCEVLIGKVHYTDLVDKYRFTHFLTVRGSLMDTYLSRDPDMLLLYEDERYKVLERKNR